MSKRWLGYLAFAAIGLAAYFINVKVQTKLGKESIAHSGLTFASLPEAMGSATATGRPILVDFSAIWSPTCRALHERLFSDERVKEKLQANFVLAGVDYEAPEAKTFMARYGVKSFPSVLILDAKGEFVRRVPVDMDPSRFLERLNP